MHGASGIDGCQGHQGCGFRLPSFSNHRSWSCCAFLAIHKDWISPYLPPPSLNFGCGFCVQTINFKTCHQGITNQKNWPQSLRKTKKDKLTFLGKWFMRDFLQGAQYLPCKQIWFWNPWASRFRLKRRYKKCTGNKFETKTNMLALGAKRNYPNGVPQPLQNRKKTEQPKKWKHNCSGHL